MGNGRVDKVSPGGRDTNVGLGLGFGFGLGFGTAVGLTRAPLAPPGACAGRGCAGSTCLPLPLSTRLWGTEGARAASAASGLCGSADGGRAWRPCDMSGRSREDSMDGWLAGAIVGVVGVLASDESEGDDIALRPEIPSPARRFAWA